LRIIYWTPLYPPDIGGIEIASELLLHGLQTQECQCVVLTSHGRHNLPDKTEQGGICIHRFPITEVLANRNLKGILRIRKQIEILIQEFTPDVIHVNFGGPAPVGFFHLKTTAASKSPVLVTFHNSAEGLSGDPETVLGQLLHQASWVTACSAAILEEYRRLMPEIVPRSSVVYYGLKNPDIPPEPLPFDKPKILCLGRMVKQKGFDLAVEALAHLIKHRPRLRLVFAGDGPAARELKKQVAALGLSGTVDFLGEILSRDVPRILNNATVVVVPSRWTEAFGLVAAEASQMARPVVAARIGGLEEAVLHGKTGLLVEPNNSHDLADAIADILDHPEKARTMGNAGRERALRDFDSQRYTDEYLQIYRRLVSENIKQTGHKRGLS